MISEALIQDLSDDKKDAVRAAFRDQRNYYEDGIKEAAVRVHADEDGLVGLAQLDSIADMLTAQTILRDELLSFACGIEAQLRTNAHKGNSWPDIPCSVHLDHVAIQCSAAGRALIDDRKSDARRHFTNAAAYLLFACTVSTSK